MSERILIVGPAAPRTALRQALAAQGYRVTEADDGAEAFRLAVRSGAALAIFMEADDASPIAPPPAEFRRGFDRQQLPLIAALGRDAQHRIEAALSAGFDDWIDIADRSHRLALTRIRVWLDRRRAVHNALSNEQRFRLIADGSNDGIWDWDLSSDAIYFSPRWKDMLGFAEDELADEPDNWFSRVHPEDLAGLRRSLAEHVEGVSLTLRAEYRMRHRSNAYRWMLLRGIALRDEDGRAIRLAGSQTDVTHRKVVDPTTGLANRYLFEDRVSHALTRLPRRDDYGFAVVAVGIDQYRAVQQSLGQAASDDLISRVAHRLLTLVRPSDTVSRIGDDVIAVLLDDLREPATVDKIVHRWIQRSAEAVEVQGQRIVSDLSVGVAMSGPEYSGGAEMCRDSIAALSRVDNAEGRVVFFDAAMQNEARRRLALEGALRQALVEGQLSLQYQPIVRLRDRRLIAFEALMRWRHPVLGAISPAEFIPIAESTGVILSLGAWAIDHACAQLADWRDRHGDDEFAVSVNVSTAQLLEGTLPETVAAALSRHRLDPQRLKLEVTESAVITDVDRAIRTLDAVRGLGVSLAIDDFGTGYSSLSLLPSLPLRMLKIDRAFIKPAPDNARADRLIASIVSLGAALDLEVTAEGIETEAQLKLLTALKCDHGQGYFFSKPLSADDAVAWFAPPRIKSAAIA